MFFSKAKVGAALGIVLFFSISYSVAYGKNFSGKQIGLHTTVDEAQEESRNTGKPILVVGWADWCEGSARMEVTTFANKLVLEELEQNWVVLRLDLSDSFESGEPFEIKAVPAFQLLSTQENPEYRVKLEGYIGPKAMLEQLRNFER